MARSEQCPSRGAILCATALFATTGCFASSADANTLTVGPVEQVNLKSSTFVVLGQTYRLPLGSIAPGTLVAVDGTESASGTASVKKVIPLSQLNVPGATQLLVTGVVSAVSDVGHVRIGKLDVDINATLTSDANKVAVGQVVKIVGTQPTSGGTFLAQSVAQGIAGSGASADGIAGSGATSMGIAGSGATANGIAGSGSLGIAGSGSLGIAGSGSSAKGIAGSGASSNGIAGSGATASGIAGSGSLGIAGSGSLGIAGSGSSASGIAGSGASSNGIAGSGATASGIAGSGSLGIAGSGSSAKGIAGSGASAAGIAGSGA